MRIKEPLFYRKAGVRTKNELIRPRLVPQTNLKLPIESIVHFLPSDNATVGPTAQEQLLLDVGARVFIEHVTDLATKEGNPRRTSVNPTMLQNEYRRKTRGIRPLRKDTALIINPRNVLVVNYGLLNPLYRYIPSFKAHYFRWYNINETFWTKVVDVHQRFGWNQYIDFELPDVLPTYDQFMRFERSVTQKSLQEFSTPQSLNLMDIWRWLGDRRNESGLRHLSPEVASKVNLIFRVRGYYFVLNLGLWDKWRLDKDEEDAVGIEGSTLQRRFLRLLLSLKDYTSGVTTLDDGDESDEAVVPEAVTKTQTLEVNVDLDIETMGDVLPTVDGLKDPTVAPTSPEPTYIPTTASTVLPEASGIDTPDSPDLPETRYFAKENTTDPLEEYEEPKSTEEQLTESISGRAWELHEAGLISAKAYKRALDEAETYKKIPNPFTGTGTISESLEISLESLEIPDEPIIDDRSTIIDKSMLSSKIRTMSRKYVSEVMEKDILNAVIAIQKQGVAVRDYKVETVRDAMNHYQIHRVTVKPVRGRQTTLMFRIPVIDKDGRFISNGNTMTLRTQRADIPLRKVSPRRVALTSYYNKTFVDRTSRQVNNYERWLTTQITERGLNEEDTSITDMRLGEVFDMSWTVPRSYSMLAKTFTAFTSGGVDYYFDYNRRKEHFLSKYKLDVDQIEQPNQVMVGVLNKDPVLVDTNDVFYCLKGNELEVLGSLADMLGLDLTNAPLEVADVSVANKTLPVGVVLAYQLGLSNLIESLGCEITRYRRGERFTTRPEEYTIVFQDEVLVLSRLDQRSTMVLAGFNRFHRILKEHSVWEFDRKDVYYRVLESVNMGVRYLREIEALFSSWVDPITQGLLEQMGEPTDFKGLLLRSVELLQTDWSPSEVDGAYMRYRGYERFAGMIYGELTRAAKTFNSRVSTGEAGVELNPHAVWQKIVQDPAVSPVKESNPIQDLREQEVMTYRGDGGRSGQSMVERTRMYHESDMGTVSESTVDSGDVGVVAYLSPNANFTSVRGLTRPYDPTRDGPASLFSTSALLGPFIDRDDENVFI